MLGPYGSPASKAEYKRLIVEWEANGRRLPDQTADITIPELIQRYWAHVTTYYRHLDGSPTGEVQCFTYALRPLKYLHELTSFVPRRSSAARTPQPTRNRRQRARTEPRKSATRWYDEDSTFRRRLAQSLGRRASK